MSDHDEKHCAHRKPIFKAPGSVVYNAKGVSAVILLLGGAQETGLIAAGLAERAFRVLVSTATDIPLNIGNHPHISHRVGRLNEDAMTALIKEWRVKLLVDATHPYALEIKKTASTVAHQMNVPYLSYIRPPVISKDEGIIFAGNHPQAAETAFSFKKPVFVTTGAKHLEPYVHVSRQTGLPLIVRVLQESIESSRAAGIPEEHIISGRGPFSTEENRRIIRRYGIGALVTKDSGAVGGTMAKVEAARLEGCKIVVIRRPRYPAKNTFDNIPDLIEAVRLFDETQDEHRQNHRRHCAAHDQTTIDSQS